MVSCKLVTRLIRTPLVGAYLPPSTLEHLPDLEEALKRFKDPIVLGGLNVDLNKARILRSQQVADLIVEYGLIYLVSHYCQRHRFRNLKTWSQVQQGTVLWSRCDYIFGPDRHRFELIGIHNMWNFSSEKSVLRARLIQRPTHCHARYLMGRIAFILRLPPAKELTRSDSKLQTLKAMEPVPPKLKRPPFPL